VSFMVSTSGSGSDDAMEEYKGALCLVQGFAASGGRIRLASLVSGR
jgi:hypothetical protein